MAERKGSVSLRATQAASGDAQSSAPASMTANARSTSPYGTRSRNRGARVNYAEDKDNDMDYEYTYTPPVSTARTNGNVDGTSSRRQSGMNSNKDAKDAPKENAVAATAVPTNIAAGKKRKGSQIVMPALPPKDASLSNMLSFDDPRLKDGQLVADDGTVLNVHDHIYLICEPPGEPYYLARIMEFLHSANDSAKPIDSIRVNWYYRPKDIQRKVNDTRLLFASMHSDCCPLNAIRGKCYIRHRSEIDDIDAYRKLRDHFYFERMFDRYIHRYYDVIPTKIVKNVPEAIRKVLVERWKYLLVEPQRGKELCSQMKECKRCTGYCANNDSVHCAVCKSTYHMNCVRPPLLKKPSRGFAWACGPCSRAQERRLEARNTPTLKSGTNSSGGEVEEDVFDEEEDELSQGAAGGTETPSESTLDVSKLPEPTADQLKIARMWQMRYLGQHCRVEDALDYDDRIYPRAASRIGPRHQAIVPGWPGRPVEYVKPIEIKKKYQKSGTNKAKISEAEASKERRPPWVQDEPIGYVERGSDSTVTPLFMIPVDGDDESAERDRLEYEKVVDRFMQSTEKVAKSMNMKSYATNFVDKAAELLYANSFNEKKALEQLSKVQPVRDLKEPRLKPEEVKRFEEGVARYGSELHAVTKHVKTRKEADIVRFYYQWKKTPKGREIWGNYEGRKGKKEAKMKDKEPSAKLVDDVADDEDDSAFDVEKAGDKKRGFECKFCATRHSRQWRRAPGVAPGTLIPAEKGSSSKRKIADDKWLVSALCRRCAELWRRYAIQWEDPDEIQKKISAGGGRQWKRKIDEELLRELTAAQEEARAEAQTLGSSVTPQPVPMSGTLTPEEKKEPPKKKAKTEANGVGKKVKGKEKDKDGAEEATKEKVKEAPPPPPPDPPKPKLVTCGVCAVVEEVGKQHACCRDCKMTVHKQCYGVTEMRTANKWLCEMCANDKNPVVSTNYECVLCPHQADPDAEPEKNNPYHKSSYKKKAAQEKAKDSPEFVDGRKVKDVDKHRPQQPREPLKKTAHNNWAHVICAVWTPEIKFSDPTMIKVVEGVGAIPQTRWLQECKVCKAGGGSNGACVQCPTCHSYVHISCANQAGWTLGFDIQPVKGSRRDTVSIVKLGNETGHMTAGVWCPEHAVQGIHKMNEICEETGQSVLQLYVNTYKQADLTLTGTVRKAIQLPTTSKPARRPSLVGPAFKERPESPNTVYIKTEGLEDRVGGVEGLMTDHVGGDGSKRCLECKVDVSPLWWKVPSPVTPTSPSMTNGASSTDGLSNGDVIVVTPPATTVASRSRTIGLLCNRCHTKWIDRPATQGASPPALNGEQSDRFTPLLGLQEFLAQEHARQQAELARQQQALPPPPPPQPLPPLPLTSPMAGPALGVPPIVTQMPPQLAHQMPPSQLPSMTPGHPHAPQTHGMVHPVTHPSPTRSILQHAAPPPQAQQHVSPLSQMSQPSHILHGSSAARILPPHHVPPAPPQMHIPQSQLHMSAHKARHHSPPQVHMAPHPHHSMSMLPNSGPPPPPPLLLNRQPSAPPLPPPPSQPQPQVAPPPIPQQLHAPQASMATGQGPALPPPPTRPEEPKRVMSGASGSPALANLLS